MVCYGIFWSGQLEVHYHRYEQHYYRYDQLENLKDIKNTYIGVTVHHSSIIIIIIINIIIIIC